MSIPRTKKFMLFQCLTLIIIVLLLLSIIRYTASPTSYVDQKRKQVSYEKQDTTKTYPYTIVTGSSANHLCSLENFLYSLHELRDQVDHFPRVAVYNIGMNRTQLPVLQQLELNGLIDDVVTLDHERYPRFWDVAINAGEYGWKTGIINDARIKYGGILIWLDAGNQVTKEFIENIHLTVKESNGFWSPRSDHGMGKWTHPGMFRYFGVDPKEYRYKRNCNGAAIGFDTTNSTIVNTLIMPWYECALNKPCIAPVGSSRINHRQDQAALTFLAYYNNHACQVAPRDFFGLQTHRDVACKSNLLELDVQHVLHHPSSIDFPKWERSDTIKLYNNPQWLYPADAIPNNIHPPLVPL